MSVHSGRYSKSRGGVAGLTSATGGTAIADNVIVRGDGTTGIQGSALQIDDNGNLISGTTVDDIRIGNITGGAGGVLTIGLGNAAADSSAGAVNLGRLVAGDGGGGTHVAINGGAGTVALGFSSAGEIRWSNGASDATGTKDTGLLRTAAGVVKVTDGSTGFGWLLGDAGKTRLTANHEVATNSTTLAAINNLTATVAAGRHYHFTASLFCTTVNTSGVKVAIAGTATHTDIIYDVVIHGISTPSFLTSGRATTAGSSVGVTASGTACRVDIIGTTTINVAGTMLVQAAQNAETGSAESVIVLRGSTFEVTDVA